MKHLYFVRHGESELNKIHAFAGRIDTPLTLHGKKQAEQAAAQAQNLSIVLIVSSPLARALETAQIIAASLSYPIDKIVLSTLFVERSLGSLEGKSWDLFDEDKASNPGMETEQELLARATAALAYLYTLEAETILVTGHGSFSKAFRTVIDPSQQYAELENAEIIKLI